MISLNMRSYSNGHKGKLSSSRGDGAKHPVHLFPGGEDLGIQQGMSLWVSSPNLQVAITLNIYFSVALTLLCLC